jgi:hypothetical protein
MDEQTDKWMDGWVDGWMDGGWHSLTCSNSRHHLSTDTLAAGNKLDPREKKLECIFASRSHLWMARSMLHFYTDENNFLRKWEILMGISSFVLTGQLWAGSLCPCLLGNLMHSLQFFSDHMESKLQYNRKTGAIEKQWPARVHMFYRLLSQVASLPIFGFIGLAPTSSHCCHLSLMICFCRPLTQYAASSL